MTVTYSSYLKLDELLSLQEPRPGVLEHDETLFVIIHQVYELWFKEVLHELDYLQTLLQRDHSKAYEPSPEVQRILVEVYKKNPTVSQIVERLVDLDEGFMEWRYRHVKMVQRTIGTKQGTGGSAGAEYLLTTLNQPAFPDLWAIRSEL